MKHKVLLIPADTSKKMELVDASYEDGDYRGLIGHDELGATPLRLYDDGRLKRACVWYDDIALLREEKEPINHRAMAVWAHSVGASLNDFRQVLRGTFIFDGIDFDGETTDVPIVVVAAALANGMDPDAA